MPYLRRYTTLRLLIPLFAGIVVLACLKTAAHIEHAADATRQSQAAQDAQRAGDAVQGWIEVHRDALYGMAAVFNGAAPLNAARYANAARTLAPMAGEMLMPPVAFVTPDHRIRFSTDRSGDLAAGKAVNHIAALQPLLKQLASAPVGQITIGPLFANPRGGWSAYLALAMRQRKQPGVLLTLVDFQDLRMAHADNTPGLVLRLALQTSGQPAEFVAGPALPTPNALFSIDQAYSLHGAIWRMYWDVMPNYAGNQAWSQARLLALVLRAGGIVLAVAVGLSWWILLGLLQRGTRRERELALAHTQLAQSEHHYRSLIDQVPGAVFRCEIDEARTMRYLSPAIEPLCGCTAASLIGNRERTYASLIHPDDRPLVAHTIRHALISEELYEIEYRLQRSSGSTCWVFERGIASHGVAHTRQIDGVIIDITARKQIEDQLREARDRLEENVAERTAELQTANEELTHAMAQLVQSEKLASLGSLVAGIAHELNTPLGNTVTVASTLAQKVEEFDHTLNSGQLRKSELMSFVQSCTEAAALVQRNAQRAAELISNFKQVAVDTASTRRRSFNLRQTVEEVLSTLRPQLKHTPHRIELDMPETLVLESYPGPLEQILTNLVTNSLAHAFTQTAKGEIRISAVQRDAQTIELVFEDNGSGIPPQLRKRVFDPFFTTRLGQGGSGLGLYIVYSLVHGVLGGRLTLASAPSGGARFEIELPCIAPHPQPTEASSHVF